MTKTALRWTEEELAAHFNRKPTPLPGGPVSGKRQCRIPGGSFVDQEVFHIPKKFRSDEEHHHQVKFFEELEKLAKKDKRYARAAARTFAIPNGGHRGKKQAGRLKAEGVKAGVSDIFLALPSAGYHGFFLEMKSVGKTPSREQTKWIQESIRLRYYAACCQGWELALAEWKAYVDETL